MYEVFSANYDRFVNWEDRLAYEMPFINSQISSLQSVPGQPLHILDAACGTGMHAIALAGAGHQVSGADLFPQMIEKATQNASAAGVQVRFKAAGLGDLSAAFGGEQFDLVLCLGNSLPHLLSEHELIAALADFAAVLRPGGMLLIQNRNFDAVMRREDRWMEPQTLRDAEGEWIFQRFYDFLPGGLIRFNIVTLKHNADSGWQSSVSSTLLRAQLQRELEEALTSTGFNMIRAYGSMQGDAFSTETSGNLIMTARKA